MILKVISKFRVWISYFILAVLVTIGIWGLLEGYNLRDKRSISYESKGF